MLSRFFQIRYGLPEGELLGYDNYHKMNPAIPRIRFTHDRYIRDYTKNRDSKRDFYHKNVILLVRDPRDVAVSNYFQWINTVNPYKKQLLNLPEHPEDVPLFEYAMTRQFGIPRTVDFLNAWAGELEKIRNTSADPLRGHARGTGTLTREHSGLHGHSGIRARDRPGSGSETSFENMKKLEQDQTITSGSRRLMVKDPNNPDAYKVRRGKVGGYTDYFSDREIRDIDRLIATLPPVYGYAPDAGPVHE